MASVIENAVYKTGSSGTGVTQLQTALKNAGYNIAVDGQYGQQTANAVKQYQTAKGLTVDGVAGSQTLGSLYGSTPSPTNIIGSGTNTGTVNKDLLPYTDTGTGNKSSTPIISGLPKDTSVVPTNIDNKLLGLPPKPQEVKNVGYTDSGSMPISGGGQNIEVSENLNTGNKIVGGGNAGGATTTTTAAKPTTTTTAATTTNTPYKSIVGAAAGIIRGEDGEIVGIEEDWVNRARAAQGLPALTPEELAEIYTGFGIKQLGTKVGGDIDTTTTTKTGVIENGDLPATTTVPTTSDFINQEYQGKYDTLIEQFLAKYLNPEPFKYDYNTDPSYKAYEKQYTQLGQNAYQDAIGTLSALTGGRANTAAASAAGQQQNAYMQQLSNIIPQLEQQAYGRHQDTYNNLAQQLGLLQGLDQNDYNRFSGERDFDYGVTRDIVSDTRYDAEQAKATENENKQEWISTIEQFSGDYQKEINRINANVAAGDTSEQWKVPYLTVARQGKIKQQAADAAATEEARVKAQAAGNLAEYNRAMDRWKTSGVVSTQADADILGVPIGTKTATAAKSDSTDESPMKLSDYEDIINSSFYIPIYKSVATGEVTLKQDPNDPKIWINTPVYKDVVNGKQLDKEGLLGYLYNLKEQNVSDTIVDNLATKYGLTETEIQSYFDRMVPNKNVGGSNNPNFGGRMTK